MAINEKQACRQARAGMNLVCHVLEAINGIMEAAKSGGCYYSEDNWKAGAFDRGEFAGEVRQDRK